MKKELDFKEQSKNQKKKWNKLIRRTPHIPSGEEVESREE